MKKPKEVKLIQWIDTGIFQPSICFSCGYNPDELKAYLKKIKANDWLLALSDYEFSNTCWYGLKRVIENTVTKETKTFFFIIIPRFDFQDDDCFIKLAHEALHICQFFLPDVLDRNREFECEAYLHTHIMRQCIKHLRGK